MNTLKTIKENKHMENNFVEFEISSNTCTNTKSTKYSTSRKEIFDKDKYYEAMKIFYKLFLKYYSKPWFLRLFISKPVKPNINDFIHY